METQSGMPVPKPVGSACQQGVAALIALAIAAVLPAPPAGAQDCSIDAQGEDVYARARQVVESKFSDKEGFVVEPYGNARVGLGDGCVFSIELRFQFDVKNQINRRTFVATMEPRAKAPQGMKILSSQVRGG